MPNPKRKLAGPPRRKAQARARARAGAGAAQPQGEPMAFHQVESEPAWKLARCQEQLQELQRALARQTDRLNQLAAQLEDALNRQHEEGAVLADLQDILTANGLLKAARSPYQGVVRRIRDLVRRHVPRGATVIVATKGDPELLKFEGRRGWHFPRNAAGNYAGYYPDGSLSAIAQLEALRAQGGQYLLFPASAFWWLDYYRDFRQHLEQRYRLLLHVPDTCLLYALTGAAAAEKPNPTIQLQKTIAEFELRYGREPAILDWHSSLGVAQLFPQCAVFLPSNVDGPLPYLDHSIDLVVVGTEDGYVAGEARRVAIGAVLTARGSSNGAGSSLSVEWVPSSQPQSLPSASIIIPCYNGRALTEACLESLLATLPPSFAGQILLVDDASSDDTPAALKSWQARDARIQVHRNRRNLGFVDTCNRGAAKAKGEFLIFLNNDVVLLPGWLPPLLRLFRERPLAGAVGGKLILSDGTLQEAGSSVFCDGSAMNFGRGDTDLEAPLYNFVREVDYCSGALLATPRTLFEALGGFDPAYRPGYYEDTDYCFKVRQKGYRVYYQPESAVVHREGGTAGTDTAVGMKRFQVINQTKFISRWQDVLRHQPARPSQINPMKLLGLALRSDTENTGGQSA